ncbi:sensor histidine kinase [Corallococcus silvisoli]|uniref:sensor histidine kinase n=1 Tax=Corallococcus silvisoli TaxID=2697031 RepID=UPI0022A76D2F|nr:sensor histidine kinase [Corallococcus silvisoli]
MSPPTPGLPRVMPSPGHPPRRLARAFAVLVPVASVFAPLLAAVVLGGWALGIPSLIQRLIPVDARVMPPDIALGLMAAGVALWLLHVPAARGWRLGVGRGLATAAVLLGAEGLGRYLAAEEGPGFTGPWLRALLARSDLSSWVRPSPGGALSLLLLGVSLWLLHVRERRGWYPARWLAFGVALIASRVFIGFLYQEHALDVAALNPRMPPSVPMGIHTALALLLLSLGVLSVHPEHGMLGVLLRDDLGGHSARRLLPAALFVVLAVGGVRLLGEWLGLYGTAFGVTLFVLLVMVAFIAVSVWNADALSRLHARRLQAEDVLRLSEERFRTAFEHAPIGMALLSVDGRFLDTNAALRGIVGYSRDELLSRSVSDITVPEDLPADQENAERLRSGDINSFQREKHYIHKDGRRITILVKGSVVRDAQGAALHFISQIQDITERNELAQAWRFLAEVGPRLAAASLEPRKTLATVAALAVPTLADWCLVDFLGEDGDVQGVETAAAMPETAARLREMLKQYPHAPFRQGGLIASVLRSGQPVLLPEVSWEVLQRTAEDAAHLEFLRGLAPASALIVALRFRGQNLGALILATSESGRRYGARDLALAEELARRGSLALENAYLHQRSEQATRVRDEVLRIVAHDLRAPLNVISLSTGMLARALPAPGGHKSLESIEKSVHRANRLIQDLLDVARMEGGNLTVDREPLEVAPLIQEAVEQHRALMEAKSLQLVARVPRGLPPVLADRERVLQILSNLMGNALKFTPEGGRITLRVQPEAGQVRFLVSDTGPGIAAADLPHLFERFWQAGVKRREGAGLGLAIVKGLVEAHGGQVHAESRAGGGSTFGFTLPAGPVTPATDLA